MKYFITLIVYVNFILLFVGCDPQNEYQIQGEIYNSELKENSKISLICFPTEIQRIEVININEKGEFDYIFSSTRKYDSIRMKVVTDSLESKYFTTKRNEWITNSTFNKISYRIDYRNIELIDL